MKRSTTHYRVVRGLLLVALLAVPVPGAAQVCGDINQSQTVTATDALGVLAVAAGLDVELICEVDCAACTDTDFIPAGQDCWQTRCGETKFNFCDDPIPADFFDPGSDPFSGVVELGGTGGPVDTIIRRTQGMTFSGALPEAVQVPIELVELDLISCEPITVTSNGGASTNQWNVAVDISQNGAAPPGMINVTKTHANGGQFSADFSVVPVFTFTRVGNPQDVRVLDLGGELVARAIPFVTTGPAPWVHSLNDPSVVGFSCGTNFIAGVEQDLETFAECCRPVGHATPGAPGHIHVTGLPDCSACGGGACCTGPGMCTQSADAATCTGEYKGDGTTCADSDGDGIADVLETNDCTVCVERDACNVGTDPNNPDTDGDGVDDGTEILTNDTDPCVAQ